MKRIPVFAVFLAFFILTLSAQDNADKKSYTFLLTGASFASPNNGWEPFLPTPCERFSP